jgi:hypothetical protein
MEVATPAGAVKSLIKGTETFWIYEAWSNSDVCEAALTTGIDLLRSPTTARSSSPTTLPTTSLGPEPTRLASTTMAPRMPWVETPGASTPNRDSSSTEKVPSP